jgi:hypothetical protein
MLGRRLKVLKRSDSSFPTDVRVFVVVLGRIHRYLSSTDHARIKLYGLSGSCRTLGIAALGRSAKGDLCCPSAKVLCPQKF